MRGKVYLVGAGPGDYKLITLKALECIRKADVIVYDRLANINYLKEAKENCEFINVGKQSSNHLVPQDDINRLIADKALEGKIVTRLKGGDPYVFGRGGEEGELLAKENIDFEVVPGITSAIGGLCYGGIPITHRDHASSFHVVTGHPRKDGKETKEINWKALATVKGTLVFLMGVSNLKSISENLINEGKDKDTPVAFISSATRYNQRVITTTLKDAYEVAIKENVKAPTLIVVGTVVNLRDKLNFFEKKPLLGKSIVVTRSRTQSSSLVEKITDNGGNAIEIPAIKIQKVENNTELEDKIKNLKEYKYLILSSKNGVDIFCDKLAEMRYDARMLCNTKVCAIGSQTAHELEKRGIIADIVPEKFVAESLYEELKDIVEKDDKVLIPRAKNAREFIVEELGKLCHVDEVITYEAVIDTTKKDLALETIENEEVDYITFASSSTVRNFISLIGEENKEKLNNKKIISIGPITTKTVEDFGLKVYKEAEVSTIDGMLEVISNDVISNDENLKMGESTC